LFRGAPTAEGGSVRGLGIRVRWVPCHDGTNVSDAPYVFLVRWVVGVGLGTPGTGGGGCLWR